MDLSKPLFEQLDTTTLGQFVSAIADAVADRLSEPKPAAGPAPAACGAVSPPSPYYTSEELAVATGFPHRSLLHLLRFGLIPGCTPEKSRGGMRNKAYLIDRAVFDAWYAEHSSELDQYRPKWSRRKHNADYGPRFAL